VYWLHLCLGCSFDIFERCLDSNPERAAVGSRRATSLATGIVTFAVSFNSWVLSTSNCGLTASETNAYLRATTRVADPDPYWIRIQDKNSCFEVLDGRFRELKASSVTWTFFMEA
jgi:hypothetical protein